MLRLVPLSNQSSLCILHNNWKAESKNYQIVRIKTEATEDNDQEIIDEEKKTRMHPEQILTESLDGLEKSDYCD